MVAVTIPTATMRAVMLTNKLGIVIATEADGETLGATDPGIRESHASEAVCARAANR